MNWHAVTRLGEAQILLPAALIAAIWLTWRLQAGTTAQYWLALLSGAIALTTVSKLAFIGWGIGFAGLDFTGISGHAMFAAGVYPMLARIAAVHVSKPLQKLAFALGVVLALVVAISRLEVQAHSVWEVVTGTVLGLFASGHALRKYPIPPDQAGSWMPLLALVCLAAMPWKAPPSLSHQMVTQLALALSQRTHPYTRADLHRIEAANVKHSACTATPLKPHTLSINGPPWIQCRATPKPPPTTLLFTISPRAHTRLPR